MLTANASKKVDAGGALNFGVKLSMCDAIYIGNTQHTLIK